MVWETAIICFTIYNLVKPWVNEKVRRMELENDDYEMRDADEYMRREDDRDNEETRL
jgi:hypothetical protein